jgi:succinate-semialdehyde dehydrogenase/glutarate-semialdehyde dehydrogenase
MLKRVQMLIGGMWMEGFSGERALIHNPATGEPVAEVPIGGREEARMALEAAQRAFPEWASTSAETRAALLHQAAALMRERVEELSRWLTLEQGKPIRDSRKEILMAAEVFDYYAEEGKRIFGEWIPTGSQHIRSWVIRQPIGVAAVIAPWNYPVELLAWKIAPALAAGCTVVAKPASAAPIAASEMIRALHDAGLPPGTINLVLGPGRTVGAELVENPISRKIAFTGETETGRWIMEKAAHHIKRVSLELGGQSPMIVCRDADLEKAVAAAVRRAFSNMGQICISVNRIYVAEEIAEVFIKKFVERTRSLRIGNGLDPDVELGPMFSEEVRQKTRDHIADAVSKGARVLYGGHEPDGEEFARGYFFLPTVLVDVDHSMRVMREETFGPVAPIMRFQTIDEAIALANDSPYGLAAYVFTRDLTTAFYVAERLEAGGVGVNINDVTELQAPFGGWKESGLGRELGRWGLESYLELKHIRLAL